jgi:hypothetical protein
LSREEALWGADAEAVRAGAAALFGHHPERGRDEREQAAYAVVQAARPALTRKLADALERAAGQYGPVTDEQRNEWFALVLEARGSA